MKFIQRYEILYPETISLAYIYSSPLMPLYVRRFNASRTEEGTIYNYISVTLILMTIVNIRGEVSSFKLLFDISKLLKSTSCNFYSYKFSLV